MCPPTGVYMFRKRGSCTEYNFCFEGVHAVKQCAAGLEFHPTDNRCVNAEENVCVNCPAIDDPMKPVMVAGNSNYE